MHVHGQAKVEIIADRESCRMFSPKWKPFLKIILPNGNEVCITTTIAEMIGAAGAGARERFEEDGYAG